jgi:hypothetical protein
MRAVKITLHVWDFQTQRSRADFYHSRFNTTKGSKELDEELHRFSWYFVLLSSNFFARRADSLALCKHRTHKSAEVSAHGLRLDRTKFFVVDNSEGEPEI